VSWLVLGSIIGMLTIFRYIVENPRTPLPLQLGPSGLLITGALAGALVYGLPFYILIRLFGDAPQ
jgi:hypothetical protein